MRGEGVQGVLTLFCVGVAQTCHDDRVVELKEQLGVEEVDGEGQEGNSSWTVGRRKVQRGLKTTKSQRVGVWCCKYVCCFFWDNGSDEHVREVWTS